VTKTDRLDARTLARLLASGLLDEVWTPDERTRTLRLLTNRRERLVRVRTRAKNEAYGVSARTLCERPPVTDAFGKAGRRWLAQLELPADERLGLGRRHRPLLLATQARQLPRPRPAGAPVGKRACPPRPHLQRRRLRDPAHAERGRLEGDAHSGLYAPSSIVCVPAAGHRSRPAESGCGRRHRGAHLPGPSKGKAARQTP
jgi:transposase